MPKLFEEKVALVTGGATGIGRMTALRYAGEGASVAVVDINEAEALHTVEDIVSSGGKAVFIRADMTSGADIANMVAETVRQFGRLPVRASGCRVQQCRNVRAVYQCRRLHRRRMGFRLRPEPQERVAVHET